VGLSFLDSIQFQKKTCVSSLNRSSLELLWMVAKSCTTLDGWTPIDNGMFTTYELVIRISQPSTVVQSLSSICEISDKIWGFKGFVFQCLFVLEVCETNWNERCVISSLRHQVCFFKQTNGWNTDRYSISRVHEKWWFATDDCLVRWWEFVKLQGLHQDVSLRPMSAYVFVGELEPWNLSFKNPTSKSGFFFLELLNPHLWSVSPLTQTHHRFLLVSPVGSVSSRLRSLHLPTRRACHPWWVPGWSP
jgi:hypothetical protein